MLFPPHLEGVLLHDSAHPGLHREFVFTTPSKVGFSPILSLVGHLTPVSLMAPDHSMRFCFYVWPLNPTFWQVVGSQ